MQAGVHIEETSQTRCRLDAGFWVDAGDLADSTQFREAELSVPVPGKPTRLENRRVNLRRKLPSRRYCLRVVDRPFPSKKF